MPYELALLVRMVKTTTTHMIRHILKAQGHKVGVIGTVHIMIGDTTYPIHNTTPDVVDCNIFFINGRGRCYTLRNGGFFTRIGIGASFWC